MTDGRDENNPGTAPGSRHTLDEVLDKVSQTDTTVYAIGLGANVDRGALQRSRGRIQAAPHTSRLM